MIFVSDEHFQKAFSPISVALSGIVIFVSDEHLLKVYEPIFEILFGIMIELISCSINLLKFNILIDFGSSIPFNIVFPNKTCLPIISTIFGIVIFVSDEHSLKI